MAGNPLMEKVSGPFMVSADTKEMPGKAKLLFVSFEEKIFPIDQEFEERQFRLIDQSNPHVIALRKVLG